MDCARPGAAVCRQCFRNAVKVINAIDLRDAFGRQSGNYQGADARKSLAITARRSTAAAFTIALGPSISMSPSRASSLTCMKRDSKIRSVMMLMPREREQRHHLRLHVRWETRIRQRRDVRGLKRPRRRTSSRAAPLHRHAASFNLSITRAGFARAPLERHLAVGRGGGNRIGRGSMRSGMTSCRAVQFSTPVT